VQVVQPLQNAAQVADAIIAAVLEAAGVNLVHDAFLPPMGYETLLWDSLERCLIFVVVRIVW